MSRRIPVWILAGLAISTLALLATPASAARPVAVSPGSAREVTMIDQLCPSFSWGAVEGARGYELVVYGLPEGVEVGLEKAVPLVRERLPGGALSWTPSMERCLAPGGRYAWLVRSLGEEGTSDWSEPRLFETAVGPSPAEVEQALAVLRAYLAAGEVELEKGSEAGAPAAKPEAGERREASRARSGAGLESPGGPEGVPVPDVTAVRAQVPDPAGVTFGLHGISASTDAGSSGVVGESTATSGSTFGVLGEVDSAAGVAGAFDNTAGGQILSGRNNAVEVFSVDGTGDVTVSGLVDGVDVSAHAADANAHHTPPTSLPPSGSAGGDLAGTFPNPDVVNDSHTHTGATVPDLWVDETGDTMTGTLTLTPGAGYAFVANDDVNLASGNVFKGGVLFIHDNGTANTALGNSALASNTTGSRNTANGYNALQYNTGGTRNTASGSEALRFNAAGYSNTATGVYALRFNTASNNTATGASALRYNTTGNRNTATGASALRLNTTGFENTASGFNALDSNTTGYRNTASGIQALGANTTGRDNTAVGRTALASNTTGARNTAVGMNALYPNTTGYDNAALGKDALRLNTTGYRNTAVGMGALHDNTTGSDNIALGFGAGYDIATGSSNIDIGNRGGSAAESGTIRIGTQGTQTATYITGIRGVTTGVADAIPVLIDSSGQLGTISSSRRFKKDIKEMAEASEKLLDLRPVTFKYKQEPVEGEQPVQFGLIAEEVAEVFPDLVVYDGEGQPETVRYHLLSSMLLNELQKQHRQLADQRQLIERLIGRLARLEAVEAKGPVATGSRHPPPADRTGAP